jgi:hypothetical protein
MHALQIRFGSVGLTLKDQKRRPHRVPVDSAEAFRYTTRGFFLLFSIMLRDCERRRARRVPHSRLAFTGLSGPRSGGVENVSGRVRGQSLAVGSQVPGVHRSTAVR